MGIKLWMLRLIYWGLCGVLLFLLFAFPLSPVRSLFLTCAGVILVTWATIMTFVFHIDIGGLSLFGVMVQTTPMAPIEDGENIEFREKFTSGGFNRFFPWWANTLGVLLTNKRLVIRFVTSRRGICLMSVPVGDIQTVTVRRRLLGWQLFHVDLVGDHKIHRFILATYRRNSWIEAFEGVGISVQR